MDNGYSLSDLRAATGDGNGFGGNGAWWMVILFLICFMGGGFWGNRQGEFGQYATAASQQEILFGQHFGQLNDRLTNLGNGVCNLGFEMQGGIGQLGKEVALAQAGTNTTIMQTGNNCDNRLATANLSAQMDRQTCDITNAIRAEGEQTRALMQANEIQQLRDKVNALQMDNRMYGVVRYPNGYTYTAGQFCGCGGCA